jgi:hypothetical protein
MNRETALLVSVLLVILFYIHTSWADTTTNIKYSGQPVQSAFAPSVSAYGSDMCRSGVSGGANTGMISISGGATVVDENCEMLRQARLLNDLGLKVASVALMCQTDSIFIAMLQSGSPCPYLGSLGASAERAWYEKRPDLFKKVFGENYTPPTVTYPME